MFITHAQIAHLIYNSKRTFRAVVAVTPLVLLEEKFIKRTVKFSVSNQK